VFPTNEARVSLSSRGSLGSFTSLAVGIAGDVITFVTLNGRLEYLSTEPISDFVSFITNSFEFLTFGAWMKLYSRICFLISNPPICDQYESLIKHLEVPDDSPFAGIISFLTNEVEGNVREKGSIEVSVSGIHWSDIPLKDIVDFEGSLRGFATPCVENSWIQIDFRDYRIIPIHYSVRSRMDGHANHLRNWAVEDSENEMKLTAVRIIVN
jgi:hypothetical protein